MQFKQGTRVYTKSGERVGEIDRVVMDPRSKEVTHLIISKRTLFQEDKVVPIHLIEAATPEGIHLRSDAGELEALPNFEEKHYVAANDAEPAIENYIPTLYWYPPVGALQIGGYGPGLPEITEIERNVPENSVALHEGAKVIASDEQDVGRIEQILTEQGTDRMTFFVVEKGMLNKEHKLIPSSWIRQVTDEEVHLAVNASQVEQLRAYEG